MPAFVLALTNPAFYLPTIMKTVTLGQQASATNAGSAGRELVGSTLMGAWMATLVWGGLLLQPNLWMLMLWMVAAALWAGAKLFGVMAHVLHSIVLEQRPDHDVDLARARRLKTLPSARMSTGLPPFELRCLSPWPFTRGRQWGYLSAGVPRDPKRWSSRTPEQGESHMLRNLMVGLPIMLLCLALQAAVSFWSVRFYMRQIEPRPLVADCSRTSARC